MRSLFNAINKQCILNYQPTQHASVDESVVPYFEKHEAKQYIHDKPIKFGFNLWVMANPLGYCTQFRLYASKDSILQEYESIRLGIGAPLVANLVSKLPVIQTSNDFLWNVGHQMRLLMCPQTSLQYEKIIKIMWISWIWLPPLLINNQFKRSNVIVIMINGEWILNN